VPASLRAVAAGALRPWHTEEVAVRGRTGDLVILLAPLAAFLLSVLIFTSFRSETIFSIVMGAVVLMAAILAVPSKGSLRRLATFGGGLLIASIFPLIVVGVRGPLFFWYEFWTSDTFRIVAGIVGTASVGWVIIGLLAVELQHNRMTAGVLGHIAILASAPMLLTGLASYFIGLERALTLVNDQLVILPLGLSRILGITTHLNIPTTLPRDLTIIGVLLLVAGAAAMLTELRRPRRTRRREVAAL
jgi:hypothetical protein